MGICNEACLSSVNSSRCVLSHFVQSSESVCDVFVALYTDVVYGMECIAVSFEMCAWLAESFDSVDLCKESEGEYQEKRLCEGEGKRGVGSVCYRQLNGEMIRGHVSPFVEEGG